MPLVCLVAAFLSKKYTSFSAFVQGCLWIKRDWIVWWMRLVRC